MQTAAAASEEQQQLQLDAVTLETATWVTIFSGATARRDVL
jgi:hypothetical protein